MDMKLRKYFLITTLSVLALYSCREDDESIFQGNDGPVAARFTSTVSGEVRTKASGASWDVNDKIGIFMKKNNQPLPGNIVGTADNAEYTTSNASGNFHSVSSDVTIYYPADGTAVDFIAYYPYQSVLSNYIYPIDLTDQSSQEKIDLLYSNNARGYTNASPPAGLSFSHQLVKVVFNITAGEGISDLNGLTTAIAGTNTKADFNLATGAIEDPNTIGDIVTKTTVVGSSAVSEAMILPIGNANGIVFKFTLSSGKVITWNVPNGTSFDKGRKYSYNITLKDSGSSVTPGIGWIETPVIESIPNTVYVKHGWPNKTARNYAMLYDTNYKMAYWVAYPLHSMYIGDSGRNEEWAYDPDILPQYQPNLKTSWATSGYDRGHQIPSGDRTADVPLNKTTFYYSNMVAQVGREFNQSIWADLEGQVRTWTKQCDTMYVVTGSMPTSKTDPTVTYAYDKSGGKAAMPKYMYKALAKRIGDTYYTLAFKLDNIQYSDRDYNKYRLTVTELEEETGFTFFPGIDASTKNTIVTNQWK
jgi:endonuclease G